MRWKSKREPQVGDTKKKAKFLFLPLELEGETRWLEVCDVIYQYKSARKPILHTGSWEAYKWVPVRWGKE